MWLFTQSTLSNLRRYTSDLLFMLRYFNVCSHALYCITYFSHPLAPLESNE